MNVLAFFAHPDDETMLCGGTLALLARQSAQVNVMIATRGEGGEMGNPPLTPREDLGTVRTKELRCATTALGANNLILLDYFDPLVGPDDELFPFTEDLEGLSEQVVKYIVQTQADVLISHGVNGEYGHPAHQLVHQAAAQAVARMGERAPLFYSVAGHFKEHPYPRLTNADAPAHLIIDITPVLPQKVDAAMCHRTQHDLFVRRRSEEAGRRLSVEEVVMPTESLTRVFPPFDNAPQTERPQDALVDLLWQTGLVRLPSEG